MRLPAWAWSQLHNGARPQPQTLLFEQKCLLLPFLAVSVRLLRGLMPLPEALLRWTSCLSCVVRALRLPWRRKRMLQPVATSVICSPADLLKGGFRRRKQGSCFILSPLGGCFWVTMAFISLGKRGWQQEGPGAQLGPRQELQKGRSVGPAC